MFFLYIATLAVFDLAAIILIKFWHLKGNIAYLLGGILSFAVTAFVMGLSLKYEGVAIVNILWVALSTILVTIVGYYFFKEPIALRQFIGIAIIIVGLIIVEYR